MISHLRLATVQPGHRAPGGLSGRSALHSGRKDQTALIQNSLQALLTSRRPDQRYLATGDMPAHFAGRGHLEGTCIAKIEGLLENKKERRKRKRTKRNRGKEKAVRGAGAEGSGSDDYYSNSDDDSDEEEEERKVWKPCSSLTNTSSTTNPFSSSTKMAATSLPQQQKRHSQKSGDASASSSEVGCSVDADIRSLNREGLDWNKNTKFGKKSNVNFQEWLEGVAKKLHGNQVVAEDAIFTSAF